MDNKANVKALLAIVDALVDVIKESGSQGVPGGTLYAALMAQGCNFQQFENLMSLLCESGKVVKRGQLYFAV